MLSDMRVFLAVVLCLGVAAGPAATVVVPADFTEVVTGSSLIALGRVVDVRPSWTDGRRQIDSVVTVEVFEWYRGGGGDMLSFTTPGGTIGRYQQRMVGAPTFTPGDEAFLFLKERPDGLPVVFGLSQGVFRVRPDARGQRQVVRPALLLPDGQDSQIVRRGDPARRPVAVATFVSQLRGAMAAPRAAVR
jgi:hypothetical protein